MTEAEEQHVRISSAVSMRSARDESDGTQARIRVVARLRPSASPAEELVVESDSRSISVDFAAMRKRAAPAVDSAHYVDNSAKTTTFHLDSVLCGASQEVTYAETVAPLLPSFIDGRNVTVLCYGQTGAGKTFTMMGDAGLSYGMRGIIPRTIAAVYELVGRRPHLVSTIRVSYLEIYNEQLYDLLSMNNGQTHNNDAKSHPNLHIRTDASGDTHVAGLATPVCRTEQEAHEYLFRGDTGRVSAEHELNARSSRSHVIFTIYLDVRDGTSDTLVTSKMHLVDLAGSERTKRAGYFDQATPVFTPILRSSAGSGRGSVRSGRPDVSIREANHINKSLVFLEQVVLALTKSQSHVPYRQSKLTSALRDSLGGNSQTVLVANVSHESANLMETVSTLRFAATAMRVSNIVRQNRTSDPLVTIKRLRAQVQTLKDELQLRQAPSSGVLTPDESHIVHEEVKAYVAGTISHLPVRSVAQAQEAFALLRDMITGGAAATPAPVPEATIRHTQIGTPTDPTAGLGKVRITGRPASRARPQQLPALLPAEPVVSPGPRPPCSRDDAFAEYIVTEAGGALWEAVGANRDGVSRCKEELRAAAASVNAVKTNIDALKSALNDYYSAHASELADAAPETPLPDEMAAIFARLGQQKEAYQAEYARFAELRDELGVVKQHRAGSEERLAAEFDAWFSARYSDPAGASREDEMPNEPRMIDGEVTAEGAFDAARTSLAASRARGELAASQKMATMKRA